MVPQSSTRSPGRDGGKPRIIPMNVELSYADGSDGAVRHVPAVPLG